MILKNMNLTNFKGIKALDIDFSEYGNIIAGDNATGKTTVYDAFLWLLFGKDSADRQKFNIKTLDGNGEPVHNLNHSAKGTFAVAGGDLTLERRYYEVWTRKRGDAQQRLTGHTTDYFINDVPAKEKEYAEQVEALVGDMGLFKIVTGVMYFSTTLPWKDRRRMLLDMAGDIGADGKILGLKMFSSLTPMLDGKTIDQLQREMAAKAKEIRAELERIPVRIDELMMRIPETFPDPRALRAEKDALQARLRELDAIMGDISAQAKVERAKVTEASGRVMALERKLSQRRADVERERLKEERGHELRIEALSDERARITRRLEQIDEKICFYRQSATDDAARLEGIKAQYMALKAEDFTVSDEDTACPTCGQELPEEMAASKTEDLRDRFEARKAMQLRSLETEGRKLNEKVSHAREEADVALCAMAEEKERLSAVLGEMEALKQARPAAAPTTPDDECMALEHDLEAAKTALDAITPDAPTVPVELAAERSELMERLDRATRAIAGAEEAERDQARVRDLEEQQVSLSDALAQCEKTQFLCDDFIVRRAKLTEKHINAMFKEVSFTLFRPQVNGGIDECCEAVIEGVPYADANNAKKINAGLEIIDTISRHYNVQAPIFIDNAEAVRRLASVPLQIIELRVSADPTLTVSERL